MSVVTKVEKVAKAAPPSGVVVVDKPIGPTSHDVVARARRALGTRAIGHAGTLDPMASGVLVLAVGEGTKLVPWLTADDKHYEATLRLGAATASLDAMGEVVETAPVPSLDVGVVTRAASAFVGLHPQRAPVVSAIKVDGVRLHARARRGEQVEAPVRDVWLHEVEVLGVDAVDGSDGLDVRLSLKTGKGFYVRSFGRDLAVALGTVGHLVALRRTASGHFGLGEACPMDELAPDRVLPLSTAVARVLPTLSIDDDAATDARHGRRVRPPTFEAVVESGSGGEVVDGGDAAMLHEGTLVAIGRREGDVLRVVRGFVSA